MNTTMLKFLGIALLATTSAFAQDATKDKADNKATKSKYTSIGPVAGFGHSWVSNNVNQFKPSGYLGFGLLYSRYEHWGFGGTLTASHEGFSHEVYTPQGTFVNTYDPTYLRFTPRAYYFFGQYKDNVRPKVFAGPSIAYKLVEDQYIDVPTPIGVQYPDMFQSFDFGLNAGAGVNIKIGKYTWLNLDADYYHGLLDVTNTIDNNMNRSLRANVGIMIGI